MLKFSVPKMSCGHCAAAIAKAIKSVDPQAEVEADIPARQVTVRTSADADKISQVIATAGYESDKLAA